ncbi:MAG: dephospho-CoA kinase [Clostridium sp.]|nr:dephospho-CoA kinase [Clostridium sp.]
MKIIGITGGVGSGKSALLSYVKENYSCRVILADEAAHKVKEPGEAAYGRLVELLSDEVLNADGTINREKMAEKIFVSKELLGKVNSIVHPAVKELILGEIDRAEAEKDIDFLFIEAALLIENGYLDIVDEMWYIYAEEAVRRRRLKEARGYSEEKTEAILQSQLSEEDFRKACVVAIDNGGSFEAACRQVDVELRRLQEQAGK